MENETEQITVERNSENPKAFMACAFEAHYECVQQLSANKKVPRLLEERTACHYKEGIN